jgi:hypothetical protein
MINNSLILGMILGDGYIDPSGRLFIEHSSKQSAYVWWKYNHCKRMQVLPLQSVPKLRVKKRNKTNSIHYYETLYFRTRAVFLKERALLYSHGVKTISKQVCDLLDAQTLAVLTKKWTMVVGIVSMVLA